MTLDHILNTALQRDTSAVLLLNEVYVPIAGRGDLSESDAQSISRLLAWTEIGTTGQIAFEDDRRLHFHHAESHTLVLVRSSGRADSPASTERANGPSSVVSGSVETVKGRLNSPTGP